jgi:hypothetical protein
MRTSKLLTNLHRGLFFNHIFSVQVIFVFKIWKKHNILTEFIITKSFSGSSPSRVYTPFYFLETQRPFCSNNSEIIESRTLKKQDRKKSFQPRQEVFFIYIEPFQVRSSKSESSNSPFNIRLAPSIVSSKETVTPFIPENSSAT